MKKLKKRWSGVYLSLMLLFMYAPILFLFVFSFNENKSMSKWGGFSLKWYVELFKDTEITNAIGVTLIVALLSAAIATVIGSLAAIGIDALNKKLKGVVMGISNLPTVNPDIVTGISLMLLYVLVIQFFAKFGVKLKLGFMTMLLSHIAFNIPYVVLSVMPRLKSNVNMLYEAALDLGASPAYAIRKILIPDIMPGVLTGFILAFTMSLDDFVITFFTRQGIQNLSIVIYTRARRGIKPTLNALSVLMFLAILILLLIINWRAGKQDGKEMQKTSVLMD